MDMANYHQLQLGREVGEGRRLRESALLFDYAVPPCSRKLFRHDLGCGINETNSSKPRVVVENASDEATSLVFCGEEGYVVVNNKLAIGWTDSSCQGGKRNLNLGLMGGGSIAYLYLRILAPSSGDSIALVCAGSSSSRG
jgi:hypothetical protein